MVRRWGPWVSVLARLVVGAVWVVAAALKLPDPQSSITAVRAYQLLPLGATQAVGYALPLVELAVGVLLIAGLFLRPAALVSVLLQAAFITGIVSVWARGIAIDCGCFGGGGADPDAFSKYPWEIARDTGLLLLSLWLLLGPASRLALDRLLFPATGTLEAHDVEASSIDGPPHAHDPEIERSH